MKYSVPFQGLDQLDAYRWVILSILFLSQFVMSMGAYSWGPLAPFLIDWFHFSRAQLGTFTSALYFVSTLSAIPSGMLVDRYGARLMLVLSLPAMGLPFTAISLGNGYTIILVLSALCGLGYGVINQISTKGIMIWFTAQSRATAMGLKQTGVTMGGAVGALLIPAISKTYGWKLAVCLTGGFMLTLGLVAFMGYRDRPAIPPAMDSAPQTGRRRTEKMHLSRILLHPELKIIVFTMPLLTLAQSSFCTFFILYLQESFRFSEVYAGSFLTVAMIAGTSGRVVWGYVSDRLFSGDRYRPAFMLSGIACISTLSLAVFPLSAVELLLFFIAALVGFTFLGWNALLIVAAAEIVGQELAGSIMGVTVTIAYMGMILGPSIFGFVVDSLDYSAAWSMLSCCGAVNAAGYLWLSWNVRRIRGLGHN